MTENIESGLFIALEGGEGSGKSTQARMLAEWLTGRGFDNRLTREPGGTAGAEAIRTLLLSPPDEGWGARAEALLFAAARSDHVVKLIRPSLAKGISVICDRFVDSSRAYQGGAGGLGDEAISELHAFGSNDLRPDMTIILEVDPATAARRLADRDQGVADAIGGRDPDYHQRVAATFAKISESDGDDYVVVDGNDPAPIVHDTIMAAVGPLFETRR